MNIQDLKSNTTWQEASNTINNNNNKISLAIATLENARLKNKGYFTTLEKLNEAIPNPTIGSKAYVGTSEPYAIYIVENGVWVDSGETGGDEIVAKITKDRIEELNNQDTLTVIEEEELAKLKQEQAYLER